MKVKITSSRAMGDVVVPPSKSIAHRGLICGSMTAESKIENIDFSKDITATIDCLKALGAMVYVNGNTVTLGGFDPFNLPDGAVLPCNESGSTLRFFIPLCLLSGKEVTFTGTEKLFSRPLDIYENICREQGIDFIKQNNGLTLCGKLKSGNYRIKGDVSSQFITGLMFALPLLDGISIIEIDGKFESASYVDLTISALADFGIKITKAGNRFIIMGNQHFKSANYRVEGDCSNAAFLDAFNYLGGAVNVIGLNPNTLQGDFVYKDIFERIINGEREFDLSDCPDLAPILFAFAGAKGGCRFSGTKRLKIKESDRAFAMAQELKKLGISVEIEENSVTVLNGTLTAPNTPISSHNDHRIAMAMAVLCTITGGVIENAQSVEKSYPNFFEDLKRLNIGIEIYED